MLVHCNINTEDGPPFQVASCYVDYVLEYTWSVFYGILSYDDIYVKVTTLQVLFKINVFIITLNNVSCDIYATRIYSQVSLMARSSDVCESLTQIRMSTPAWCRPALTVSGH